MAQLSLTEITGACVASGCSLEEHDWALIVTREKSGCYSIELFRLFECVSKKTTAKNKKEVRLLISQFIMERGGFATVKRGELLPIFEVGEDGVRHVDRMLNPIDEQLAVLDAAARKRQAEGPDQAPYHC